MVLRAHAPKDSGVLQYIMRKAYETGDYTMQQIANTFEVHHFTVSKALHKTSLKNACLQNMTPFPCGITAVLQQKASLNIAAKSH
ncbi:MAG: hypothetical protein NTV37_10765 [Proteobacteria bacterium]|nr:hypothetical protein [Pseudomonadota bacterium]